MQSGVVHPAFPERLSVKPGTNNSKQPKKRERHHCECILPALLGAIFFLIGPFIYINVRDHYFQNNVYTDIPKCKLGCNHSFETPPLLLVSLDGFRADYFARNLTPTLKHLFDCGVQTPYMIPSFPSITFPNHYTIVTGLFPGYHGIVDNSLFGVNPHNAGEDESIINKKVYGVNSVGPEWYGGEPLWNTVKKAGKKSATNYWPGSEVAIQGFYPHYWQKYNDTKKINTRIEELIEQLLLPEPDRPDFLTFYNKQPDYNGHRFGTDSPELNAALTETEEMISYMIKRLDETGLLGCLNIVFVSDHGMENLKQSSEFHATINDVIGTYPFRVATVTSTIGHVFVENETIPNQKSLLDSFNVCRGGNPFAAWTRQNIPRRYHYTNKRAGSLVFESAPGSKFFEDKIVLRKGDHGYDPLTPHMRAIFGAIGPSFKKRVTVEPFQNIELYNLFVDLLRLPNRAPNNGTIGRLNSLLENLPPKDSDSSPRIPQCSVKSDTTCFYADNMPLQSSDSRFCVDYNDQCESEVFQKSSSAELVKVAKSFFITQHKQLNQEFLLSAFSTPHVDTVKQSKAIEHVEKLIQKYVQKYEILNVMIGAITDTNNNNVADDADDKSKITHFFVVLRKCHGLKEKNLPFCANGNSTDILPLILPLDAKDYNCLKFENYIYRHTARLRDIELLTRLEFGLSVLQRTKLNEVIWPFE